MERFACLILLSGLLLAQAGWAAADMAKAECEKAAANQQVFSHPTKPQNHQRTITAPSAPTSSVSNQYNYVYCAAAAPLAGVASSPVDTPDAGSAGGDFSGPGDSPPSGSVHGNAHETTGSTRIEVRLSKDIGLSVDTQNSALAWIALLAAIAIVVLATWGLAHAAKDAKNPVTFLGYGLLAVGLLVLGGMVGYWWKGDVSATLTTEQVARLANSPELQRSLAEFSQTNDERIRLQAQVDTLEKELAQATAKPASVNQAGRTGAWGANGAVTLLLILAAAAVSGLWAQRSFIGQINALQVKLAESRTAISNAIDLLKPDPIELPDSDLEAEQQQREHLLADLRAAARMLGRALGRE